MYQRWKWLGAIGFLTIILSCGGLIAWLTDSPVLQRPWGADVIQSRTSCASEYCTAWSSYELAADGAMIVQFYEQYGYRCFELSPISNAGRFTNLALPYWQCTGDALPYGNAAVAFKAEGQPSPKRLRVFTIIGWDPCQRNRWLC